MYTLLRYQPASLLPAGNPDGNVNIMYHLVNTKRRWKRRWRSSGTTCSPPAIRRWTTTISSWSRSPCFRQGGMGNYRDLLLTIARNPTMIFWLDNNQNHGTAVNENWGRELLELFSMGVGSYTEKDVREASRAFTGWTFETKIHACPMDGSRGSSSTAPKITTTVRRSFWAIAVASTAKTSSTSSWSNRPVRVSCAASVQLLRC